MTRTPSANFPHNSEPQTLHFNNSQIQSHDWTWKEASGLYLANTCYWQDETNARVLSLKDPLWTEGSFPTTLFNKLINLLFIKVPSSTKWSVTWLQFTFARGTCSQLGIQQVVSERWCNRPLGTLLYSVYLKICYCHCIRVVWLLYAAPRGFGLLWKFICWDHSGTYYNHHDTTYTHDGTRSSVQHFALF